MELTADLAQVVWSIQIELGKPALHSTEMSIVPACHQSSHIHEHHFTPFQLVVF